MNTNKRDKRFVFLSTIICLLPVALYLIVYDQLPEQMGMQWDLEGNVNWYAPRAVAVFAVPFTLALIHLATILIRRNDPKRENTAQRRNNSQEVSYVLSFPSDSYMLPIVKLMRHAAS